MPEISRFLGIVIAMFHREHGPPHFHAYYGDYRATIEIKSGQVVGKFPRRALLHVLEWRMQHQAELLENWALAEQKQPLKKIEPLE